MWYVHTLEYYSAIKRNEIQINATMWIYLKNLLSKRRQTQRTTHYYVYMKCQNRQIYRDKVHQWLSRPREDGWKWGRVVTARG